MLRMSWRHIEKDRECPVANKAQFMRWIDQGDCVCLGGTPRDEAKLTIVKIEPYYLERPYDDDRAEGYVRPVACLYGTAEFGGGSEPIRIYCPLVIEGEGAGQTRKGNTEGAETE
jgi:hypothetical protein